MASGSVAFARVTDSPLRLEEHFEAVTDPAFGAVVNFIGQIRNHDPGAANEVRSIEYSCHPDTERIIGEIATRVATPETRLAVSHRIGMVPVGGLALVACVASAHRAEAYSVSRDLIETIKLELPIWKRQTETDGAGTWVGIR